MPLIDTILPHHNEKKYYFFSGNRYSRYTHGAGTDQGYPIVTSTEWRGMWTIFPGPYDASIIKYDGTKYYFFKGSRYVRYTPGSGVDAGYPKNISGNWKGLWEAMPGPYDACFYAQMNNKYYFFKGDQYVRMSTGTGGAADAGYPKKIASEWNGMPAVFPPPYDAVVQSKKDLSIYYFFKGNQYVRYKRDVGIDTGVGVYPQSTEYRWPGIWQLKAFSAITLGAYTPSGPLFSIRLLENKTVTMVPSGSLSLQLIQTIDNVDFDGFTKIYRVNNMAAGAKQNISIKLDNTVIATFPIQNAPLSTTAAPFSLAMGSCLDDARNIQLQVGTVNKMVSEQPNLMIWNGDTSYYVSEQEGGNTDKGDVEDFDMKNPPHRMFLRMFKTRHHPSVASAMCRIPAMSTWDDHDFGFNNADSQDMSALQIKAAKEVFRTCWPNNYAQSGLDKTIEHTVCYGKAEIFFPDSRSHRNPGAKKILGDAQVTSLINSMTKSNAELKILVLSSQLIPCKSDGESFFNTAPNERTALLTAFKKSTFTGRVLVLTGDVHYSELSFDGNTAANPKIIELTSSPMLLKDGGSIVTPASSSKPTRIWATKGDNYAMVNITYSGNTPIVTIKMRNASGNTADVHVASGGTGSAWGKADAVWRANGNLEQLT